MRLQRHISDLATATFSSDGMQVDCAGEARARTLGANRYFGYFYFFFFYAFEAAGGMSM